jgi:serine/threonine protein kinase
MTLPNAKKRKIFDGRYEIISLVGRGSDSVVYHARHVNSPTHEVALKVLHNQTSQESLTDRLRKEALTLVSCRHRYVVRLDDFHSVQDLCYLSMEYAQFGDLRKYLSSIGGALPVEQGRVYLQQSLEALDFVHATGVIHRDIKPDNILVLNEHEIRIADFGIALLPGDDINLEELKKGAGSFTYLPPELLEGIRYDSRSDIYGLGLCFYEALAGFHPFDGLPIAEQLEARRDDRIPLLHQFNPAVPLGLSNVIAKMMRYDPAQRFGTAAQALKALSDPGFVDTASNGSAADLFSSNETTATLWDDLDEFEIFSKAAAANEDSMEVSAQSLINDALSETGNSELDAAGDGSASARERAHTEEFDLERIKNLVDQEAQGKARAAAAMSQIQHQAVDTAGSPDFDISTSPNQRQQSATSSSVQAQTTTVGATKSQPGKAIRVACGAALATILLGAVYSRFFANEALEEAPQTVTTEASSNSASDQEVTDKQEKTEPAGEIFFFPHLARGLYAGTVSDIVPGAIHPISFISMPTRKSLVVVIGLPGWTPVEIPVPDSKTAGKETSAETITIRSNGLILTITGELSGDAITGTFTNAVTGETGTWSAKLVS